MSFFYVYVKDSECFVFKKLENEVSPDEKVISEKEYMKKSGLAAYAREHHLSYSAMMK